MTGVSTRDALAKALCRTGNPEHDHSETVDRLFASGAVVDAATLADDEALIERLTEHFRGDWPEEPAHRSVVLIILRALAAALSERGDS